MTAFASSNDALVRDQSGRIAYIVELDPAAAGAYSRNAEIPSRFPSYARGNVVNLILDMEQRVGFQSERMTSWSSTSFTAFLTPKLYDALARDPRVTLITPDVTMSFSAGDVWTDVTAGGETSGWGKQAINKLTTSSNGSTIVYVVDSGIGQHTDLNVVERAVYDTSIPAHPFDPAHPTWPVYPSSASPTCGSRVSSTCTLQQLTYMTGCYTHSSAVAGIIGAKANNGTGIQGILPNVQIVSISVTSALNTPPDFDHNCQNLPITGSTASNVKSALDWVELDLTNNNSGRPAVVNISINADNSDPGVPAMRSDIVTLTANTSNGHVGAFVVQSAGNNLDQACNHAYAWSLCFLSPSDGVMVVGAINSHGQPVVPLNGFPGFWEDYGAFAHDSGSNFGADVDVWAPGENILTTVSNTSYQAPPINGGGTIYYQNGNVLYSSVGRGSGTSFAAPHIAGLAAYYIETQSLTTVPLVETTIRNHLSNLGSFEPSGVTSGIVQQGSQQISIATHDPLPAGTPHSTPYAELVVSDKCFAPMFASAPTGCTQFPVPLTIGLTTIAYSDQKKNGLKLFNFARNNETLARVTSGNPLWVAMDSYGTSSCDLWATPYTLIGPGGSTQLAVAPRYYGANLTGYGVAGISYWLFSSNTCPPTRVSMTN